MRDNELKPDFSQLYSLQGFDSAIGDILWLWPSRLFQHNRLSVSSNGQYVAITGFWANIAQMCITQKFPIFSFPTLEVIIDKGPHSNQRNQGLPVGLHYSNSPNEGKIKTRLSWAK